MDNKSPEDYTLKPAGTVSSRHKTIVKLTLSALFAALTAAGTFISIPLPLSPVPIVLQNLFALLTGLVLGPLGGVTGVGLYLLAGAIGVPVFAGASGGFVHFLGPTGGFLFGYLLMATAAGFIVGTPQAARPCPLWRIIAATVAGILLQYIPGVIQLKLVIDDTWPGAVAKGFLPFIIGDGIKGIVAVLIASRLRRPVADHLDG
ncbi:MAG: biotin transporter BioY [Treponema sp.]|jgi:biotin transport system substrate-specific component|nr:biotin transporter BioY [Treponema sp.]